MSNTSAYLFPTIYKSHLWVGFRKRKKLFPNTALFLMFLIFSARFLYLPPVGGISLVCFHKNHHLLLSAWWEKCVYATLTSGWKALLKREIIGYKALILLEILGFFYIWGQENNCYQHGCPHSHTSRTADSCVQCLARKSTALFRANMWRNKCLKIRIPWHKWWARGLFDLSWFLRNIWIPGIRAFYLFSISLPVCHRQCKINCTFGALDPTDTAVGTLILIGNNRHPCFSPGKDVHGANGITFFTADTFFIIYS